MEYFEIELYLLCYMNYIKRVVVKRIFYRFDINKKYNKKVNHSALLRKKDGFEIERLSSFSCFFNSKKLPRI